MTPTTAKRAAIAALMTVLIGAAGTASAQTTEPESRWSAEFGLGWDNGITGNINASGVGEINNQVVVITRNTYNDVYGAGLHLRFGGGYMLKPDTEARVTFTFQSLDADFITPIGDIGTSNLYAQYSDYQTFGIDFGLRRYATLKPKLRAYGEGTIGIGFVDKTDVTLVAPGANLVNDPNDFYDQTAAFTFGINIGLDLRGRQEVRVFRAAGPAIHQRDDRDRRPRRGRVSTTSTTRARAGRCHSSSASTIASSDSRRGGIRRPSLHTEAIRIPHYLLVAAVCTLTLAVGLGRAALWEPDEPRFAEATRQMLARGDVLTPWFNDQPRFEKPILFYWLQLPFFAAFGPGELTARLPGEAAAMGCVALTWLIGLRLFGARAGWLGALALATSFRFVAFARQGLTDVPALFFQLLAVHAFLRLDQDAAARRAWLVAWAATGLAALTKGPVAVIPVAVWVAFYLLQRDWTRLRRMRLVTGPLIALAVAAPVVALHGDRARPRVRGGLDHERSRRARARTARTRPRVALLLRCVAGGPVAVDAVLPRRPGLAGCQARHARASGPSRRGLRARVVRGRAGALQPVGRQAAALPAAGASRRCARDGPLHRPRGPRPGAAGALVGRHRAGASSC